MRLRVAINIILDDFQTRSSILNSYESTSFHVFRNHKEAWIAEMAEKATAGSLQNVNNFTLNVEVSLATRQ